MKNGEPCFTTMCNYRAQEFLASTKSKNIKEMLDFTSDIGYSRNIIKEFLQLKRQIEKRDPNAKFKILDRTIVIEESNGQKSLYIVTYRNVLPAEMATAYPKKINLFYNEKEELLDTTKSNFTNDKEKEVNLLPQSIEKSNVYAKIKEKIIKYCNDFKTLLKEKKKSASHEDAKDICVENRENYEKFKSKLSNMNNYGMIEDKQNYHREEMKEKENKQNQNSDSQQGE